MAVTMGNFGSVAVIADIHGNLPALDAVLSEPQIANADILMVAGDHASGPQPTEVLERLRSLGDWALLVAGNADRELVDLARGRDIPIPDEITAWAASCLSNDHVTMLEALPHPLVVNIAGFGQVLCCHGSPRRIDDVVLVDSRLQRWQEVCREVDPEIRTIVCGHTHVPIVRLASGRLVINPGSVGMPCGRKHPSWAILSQASVKLGSTMIYSADVARRILETSRFPGVNDWVQDYVLGAPSDVNAMEAFGPMDGRNG
jgi:putative phosphoesterase